MVNGADGKVPRIDEKGTEGGFQRKVLTIFLAIKARYLPSIVMLITFCAYQHLLNTVKKPAAIIKKKQRESPATPPEAIFEASSKSNINHYEIN